MPKIPGFVETSISPMVPTRPFFDRDTDRMDYMRGFVQELEDNAHVEPISARLEHRMLTIAKEWLQPVIIFHRLNAEVRFAIVDTYYARIWLTFGTAAEVARFETLEPEMSHFFSAPNNRCICQVLPGVIHNH